MKKLIRRCWDSRARSIDMDKWTRGILQYRNTPKINGKSPAQTLFGHPVQDMIPAHRRSFASQWQKAADEAEKSAVHNKNKVIRKYNENAQDLPRLQIGNKVAIQNHKTKLWDIYGTIVDIGHHRKYFIKLQSGRVLTRNRRYIRRRYGYAMPSDQPNEPPANIVPVPIPNEPPVDTVPVPEPVHEPTPIADEQVPKPPEPPIWARTKPERLIESIRVLFE